MKIKRPSMLMIERRDAPVRSIGMLLSADAERMDWIALAPHLDAEVPLQVADLLVLDAMPADGEVALDELVAQFGHDRLNYLVSAGLLIGDHPGHATLRLRDQILRETAWWTPAAVAHRFGRWRGVDVALEQQRSGRRTLKDMFEVGGEPPPATVELLPPGTWQQLPAAEWTGLDDLFAARSTCRNFDPDFVLPLADLATHLRRVFGAQAVVSLAPGAVALKKNSPSGGGLHPVEAYLLVQRVDGLQPGLYHYQCIDHALECIQLVEADQLSLQAHELVAGQSWFANAPVQVLLAARFQRNFWKYRNHAKAWRVIHLDAGHLSQSLYLSATESGYGAFVTGAINDECAERIFGLDGLSTGAIAVCGFGRRAKNPSATEFDPLGMVVR